MRNFPMISGCIRRKKKDRLGKNISLFQEDGTKVYWGDLAKQDLKQLKDSGRFYVLSEYKSYWDVPKEAILETDSNPFHNANVVLLGLEKILDTRDKTKLSPEYVRKNKIAVIQDGVWIRDDREWLNNYS